MRGVGSEERGVHIPLWLFVLYQLSSVLPTFLIVYWMWYYRDGLVWNGSAPNWHPVLMVTGLTYFTSQSLLTFRLLPFSRAVKKALHVILHLCAATCSAIGLAAVVEFHEKNGHANFLSFHSWCGLVALVLFAVQFLSGCCTFLYPGARTEHRVACLPYHSMIGLGIFGLSALTSLIGINEKMQLALHDCRECNGTDEEITSEIVLANSVGFITLGFSCLVFVIVAQRRYTTYPQRQKHSLLL